MSEKPILFNTGMVKAILDGRKTATRRLIKPQPILYTGRNYIFEDDECPKKWEDCDNIIATYQYQPGDLLYVRETWCPASDGTFRYKASINEDTEKIRKAFGVKWHPSIHMPKEAARIWLRVTNVHVERLQDITLGGFEKEGVENKSEPPMYMKHEFERIWDRTVKDISTYGWDANPWVWVIEFERVEGYHGTAELHNND